MKWLIGIAVVCGLMLSQCNAADVGGMLEDYMWEKRLVLVFAPSADDADFIQQRENFEEASGAFRERDVTRFHFIHLTSVSVDNIYKPHLSTNPFYDYFDISARDFAVILIGKDGDMKQQWDAPVRAQDVFDLIDAMPMRRREINQ